jgi:hypothetical protein
VGDDSTGTLLRDGETLKVLGSGNITVAVAEDSSTTGDSVMAIIGNSSPTFTNVTVTGQIIEPFQTYSTAITGTPSITFDCAGGNIWRVNPSGGPGSAWTAAFTNVSITTNQATNITMIVVQGTTPFIPSAVTINGNSATVTWQGGITPTGNANKTDAVAYSVLQTGASTYTVLGQLVTFG